MKNLIFFSMLILFFSGGCLHQEEEVLFPVSEYPWHRDITATVFDISASGTSVTAFNSVDAEKENPYHAALPLNPAVLNIKTGVPENVKNLWLMLVNETNQKICFAQWEDVGPWFVDDYSYVFSSDGKQRPAAEIYQGTSKSIYLYQQKGQARLIRNSAGIDLSPAVSEYLEIRGKGTVSWRFASENEVFLGPWSRNTSTSMPHYKKSASLLRVSNEK